MTDTQRNEFVLDTMAVVLYGERRRLPAEVKAIFTKMEQGETNLYIPSLVFAEILYLSEKGRIEISLADIERLLESHPALKEHPLNLLTILKSSEIVDIPELHDRLIAGVARFLNLPLVTNDPKIIASAFVETLWD